MHFAVCVPVSIIFVRSSAYSTAFRIVYIPTINDRVFKIEGLTWHWGLVFGQLVVYVVVVEMYKILRRSMVQRKMSKREDKGTEMHVAYTMEPINNRTMI